MLGRPCECAIVHDCLDSLKPGCSLTHDRKCNILFFVCNAVDKDPF
jgi:hypothetical protein